MTSVTIYLLKFTLRNHGYSTESNYIRTIVLFSTPQNINELRLKDKLQAEKVPEAHFIHKGVGMLLT